MGDRKKIGLIKKATKPFLWFSAVVMLISTVVLFYYVRNLLQNEIEEELRSTEARIESELQRNTDLFQLPPIIEINVVSAVQPERLKDTIIFDPSQNEMEDFRELTTYPTINGKNYSITVRALIVETNSFLIAIIVSYIIILVIVFVSMFYFNKKLNKALWQPFFLNLDAMQKFSLNSHKPIALVESNVLEFSELKNEITKLTDKLRADYSNLKQFTEDVSHELQTPLAIIQAKVENIINGPDLSEEQFLLLTSIQKDIQRLTSLNKRLNLLTKIENNQFVNIEQVNITTVLEETITNLNEITEFKIVFLKKEMILIPMDGYLAEILCNNLISNAIKHNYENSKLEVTVNKNKLVVSNGGSSPLSDPKRLFTRFYRESNSPKSTGIGLAIVKRICELYHLNIAYSFSSNRHQFTVDFNQTDPNLDLL